MHSVKATDVCLYQGKFNLRVIIITLIQIWMENFILSFYLPQRIIAFGKQQRVLQLLKVGYRTSVYSAVFPTHWCFTHTRTNKSSTECEHQTTEKKRTNIRMDVTNDRRKKKHGGCLQSLTAASSVELESASLQALIVDSIIFV